MKTGMIAMAVLMCFVVSGKREVGESAISDSIEPITSDVKPHSQGDSRTEGGQSNGLVRSGLVQSGKVLDRLIVEEALSSPGTTTTTTFDIKVILFHYAKTVMKEKVRTPVFEFIQAKMPTLPCLTPPCWAFDTSDWSAFATQIQELIKPGGQQLQLVDPAPDSFLISVASTPSLSLNLPLALIMTGVMSPAKSWATELPPVRNNGEEGHFLRANGEDVIQLSKYWSSIGIDIAKGCSEYDDEDADCDEGASFDAAPKFQAWIDNFNFAIQEEIKVLLKAGSVTKYLNHARREGNFDIEMILFNSARLLRESRHIRNHVIKVAGKFDTSDWSAFASKIENLITPGVQQSNLVEPAPDSFNISVASLSSNLPLALITTGLMSPSTSWATQLPHVRNNGKESQALLANSKDVLKLSKYWSSIGIEIAKGCSVYDDDDDADCDEGASLDAAQFEAWMKKFNTAIKLETEVLYEAESLTKYLTDRSAIAS